MSHIITSSNFISITKVKRESLEYKEYKGT